MRQRHLKCLIIFSISSTSAREGQKISLIQSGKVFKIIFLKNSPVTFVMETMEDKKNVEEYDHNEYYDWELVPKVYQDDMKTGVTFRGDSQEYLDARSKLKEMLDKKGMIYYINGNQLKILDNPKNKPIKVDIKPQKGPSGKANIKIYNVNNKGYATIVISKVSDGTLQDVKTLSFKIIKYMIDGMIDNEISKTDLENFKIHPNGDHGNTNDLDERPCEKCGKTFKTKNGLAIHIQKHVKESEVKCSKCDYQPISDIDLRNHFQSSHEPSRKIKQQPLNRNGSSVVKCNSCDFELSNEYELKRHKRDKHDDFSKSTSPKPKKRKQISRFIEEEMEVDAHVQTLEMEIDHEKSILIERSNQQDEKVKRIQEKRDEEERLYKEKKQQEKLEAEKKEREAIELVKMNSKKLKNKTKNVKKKKEATLILKPYLRDIPDNIKHLLDNDHVLYPVKGDGSCGPRCLAAFLYQDQTLGPHLARNINLHFVQNWSHWKNFFELPFIREVGNGKSVKCDNEEELFEYLLNAKDGAYMWRGHEDFSVVAIAYQFNIKIITISGVNDMSPRVNIIEPNPDVIGVVPSGTVPEMIILHEENSHYNLIIPKNHILALEGGLDYQRENKEIITPKNVQENVIKESYMEEKIRYLEMKCKSLEVKLENGCKRCENQVLKINEQEDHNGIKHGSLEFSCEKCDSMFKTKGELDNHLKSVHKDMKNFACKKCTEKYQTRDALIAHEKIHNVVEHYQCEKCYSMFKTKGELDNHSKTVHKAMRNFACKKCTQKYQTRDALDAHEKSHNVVEHYQCEKCEKIFKTEDDLKEHMKTHTDHLEYLCGACDKKFKSHSIRDVHVRSHHTFTCEECDETFTSDMEVKEHVSRKHKKMEYKKREFNCYDCPYQGENSLQLKKHIQITKHNPCEYSEECYTCKKEFTSYWDLMTHRNKEHPSRKQCRYFLKDECHFASDVCWYRHEDKQTNVHKPCETCRECGLKFVNYSQLDKHKKEAHSENVLKCKNLRQGKCEEEVIYNEEKQYIEEMEIENSKEELDFHVVKEKSPPDQIQTILTILSKLSGKVENLEKMSRGNHII